MYRLYFAVTLLLLGNYIAGTTKERNQPMEGANEIDVENRNIIFPGTKWCGTGNIAQNDSDLGTFQETDKCCRTHDFCPDIIKPFQTKYNLTNPMFYTRLNCKCDNEFRQCLKSANTTVSQKVGTIYFTGLGTKCFKNEYPIKSCKRYIYFPRRRCVEYELDTTGQKSYQWFDVPTY